MSPQYCKADWCLFVSPACFSNTNYFSILYDIHNRVGRDSSVGTATRYGLDCRGDRIPVGGEIFRARPDRIWGPPILLCNGYRVIPGIKATGAWR